MHRPLLAATTALLSAFPTPAQDTVPQDASHHLVEVRVTGPAQLQRLLALDLDLAGCRTPLPAQRRVEVIASDADLRTLQTSGLQHRVVQRDLEAHYAAAAAAWAAHPSGQYQALDLPNPPLGQGAMGGHWTLAQMESILDDLFQANPAICSQRTSIGQSVQGRDLWMVKISDNVGVDENEPEVLYDALHHAREPLSMEATVVFMEWLVTSYGTDPLATFLVDERELYFVPCVNPDGYEYNYATNPAGGGLWRKNRRDNGNNTFGVDLNRNYATAWTAPNGGSSTSTSSETYRGPGPFSEPESQAMEAFAASRQFVQVFTTHTYTDVLLRAFGWTTTEPTNVADYNAVGAYLTIENGLAHGSVSNLLYIASGSAVDHHHTAHGSLGWTAELGRSNEGGFWPSGPAITDIAMRNQPMFRKVALTAGTALDWVDLQVTEAASANGNGLVEPGETGEVVVTITNAGIAASPAAAVTLQAPGGGAAIGNGAVQFGALAPLSTAGNAATPLTFTVDPANPAPLLHLTVTLTGDGRSQDRVVPVPLIAPRAVLADDFETDHGFARGAGDTASTGRFERAAPQQTTSGGQPFQPGFQHTPGGSFAWVTQAQAGSSAGSFDVDNGFTELYSPVLDLAHLQTAAVGLWVWYAESTSDDAMAIELSRNGGSSWEPLYSRQTSTGGYLELELDLGAPLTNAMQLRVRAQDLNPSLVECVVDDFALSGVVPDGSLTLLGSGRLGTRLQVAMHAAPPSFCFALAAPLLGPGTTFPGAAGTLLLDPLTTAVLPGVPTDAAGRAAVELQIPLNPALVGAVFHWQQAALDAVGVAFGGNATTLVLQ